MKRRDLLAGMSSLAATAAALSPIMVRAQSPAPQPGVDFKSLDKAAPIEAPKGKIEIIEFFWYSCPHCNAFESTLASWVKKLPKDVAFKRVPIAFQDSFVPQQRLFYALEALGLLDKLHTRVFAAIHDEKQKLSKGEEITNWMVKQGIDKAKFLAQFDSFSTATKASRATQLQTAYQVEGVPALGVAGRFYTDGELAKNMDRVLQVVDHLTAEVRRGH